MSPQSQKQGGYHHGALREALLRASLELIEEGGLQALSLRAAARRAGVSPGAPYHHFENRAALLAALAMEGFDLLHGETERAMAEAGSRAIDQLCASGQAYVRFATRHPANFRIMFRPELADPGNFPELEKKNHPVFENLVQTVLACQQEGSVPQGDPQRYVLLCWSVVHGISSLLLDGPLSCHFAKLDASGPELGAMVVETLTRTLNDAANR